MAIAPTTLRKLVTGGCGVSTGIRQALHQAGQELLVRLQTPYAGLDETRQNVYYALTSLVKKGVLRHEGERYAFVDPFFREHVARRA